MYEDGRLFNNYFIINCYCTCTVLRHAACKPKLGCAVNLSGAIIKTLIVVLAINCYFMFDD